MNIFRMILAVVFPPAAVWDKGCGTVTLVTFLTLLFWIPGAIAAMYFVVRDMQRIPPSIDERSRDVFGAAQNFKSQPLSAPPSNAPFNEQSSTQPPPQPFRTKPTPWSDSQPPAAPADPPADNPPPAPQPPARPKPPWES